MDITVVHADAHLLALDKPSGLLSVPGRGPDKQDCLSTRAQQQFSDALVVHRLDMATSGLLLMARGLEMQRALSRAFAERQVSKRYVALVAGHIQIDAASSATTTGDGWHTIDLPILLDWPNRPLNIIDARGKPSLTRWRVLAHETSPTGQPATRLALEPVTGRSHQLRVHLRAIGHPILGDALYAEGDALASAPRLLLHASNIALAHPTSGAALQLHSPCPF